jgi:hypothetical protein
MAARGIPGMDGPVAPPTPPAAPADWKAKVKFGLRKIANPAFAVYAIYEGWQQIMTLWNAHKQGKLSDQQFAAETTKIVAKLVEEYGIIQVSTWLGGAAGGAATGGAGAIPGMIAGAAAGIGLEHYFGDDISSVVNNVIDYLYSTDKKPTPAPAPEPQQNKLNPQQIGELKQYIAGMEAWVAAGNKLDQTQQQDLDKAKAMLKAAGVTVSPTPAPAPAANPVAEIVTELQSIAADVDKIYADQTPLAGENGKTEMAKISALISKHEALTEKMAKLPPDLRAPELINAENAVNKKIYLAQRSVLHRSLLQDTDPAVYAKHKAGADKLLAFEAEVNDLDVKDPDFQKKAVALARQINQMIDSLPAVPDGDRGAYMVRQQSLTAARDVMQHKQKEYEDYRAKNPTPVPTTGGPKEGQTGMYDGKKVIYRNGKWVYQ